MRSTTLNTPVEAAAGCAKSVRTASAAEPPRWNLRTSTSETRSRWSAGASPAVRMISGIRAVKAWAAMAVARSILRKARKELTQRPRNVVSSRRPAVRRL
jgi:hypothetical protein